MPPRKSTKRKHGIDEAEGSVNEQILTVLRSIDARLGRIERQGQQLGGSRQPQLRLRDASSSTTSSTILGSWKFKTNSKYSFVKVDEEGLVLIGYHFNNNNGSHPARHLNQSLTSFDGMAPKWVNDSNWGTRNVLAQLVFNDKAELNHKSGIYTLTIKYNKSSGNSNQDAAIIIGEMEFHSSGLAIAEGADWDRLLNNQRQTQLPYSRGARGVATWQSRKISEPWEDGDELKFKIDTN